MASLFFLLLRIPVKQSVSKERETIKIHQVLTLMVTPNMLAILPLFMTSGLCIACNAGLFVPLLEMTMPQEWSSQLKS
jgi:hypothetical protein